MVAARRMGQAWQRQSPVAASPLPACQAVGQDSTRHRQGASVDLTRLQIVVRHLSSRPILKHGELAVFQDMDVSLQDLTPIFVTPVFGLSSRIAPDVFTVGVHAAVK